MTFISGVDVEGTKERSNRTRFRYFTVDCFTFHKHNVEKILTLSKHILYKSGLIFSTIFFFFSIEEGDLLNVSDDSKSKVSPPSANHHSVLTSDVDCLN